MTTTTLTPENRLRDAGAGLPEPAAPLANYAAVTRTGSLLFTAGQLPVAAGVMLAEGKVGTSVTPEQAGACARQAALNALAAIRAEVGDLSKVVRVVKVVVFVASDPSFTGQPGVADAASEVMNLAFGAAGRHSRSAVGVAVLPKDAPVEVEVIVEVGEG
ncbi:RidA family protein [Kineosporia succinea]|uniref:Enamine deaminase RidA (YjgF/YER057c/UK114 family) n=1 Tax=Kineosporia succinea TaxID=84632 RepID=A0ABT9PA18_9ACTN|nr:RidA family protein [Kineosporia succinea]MDP9829542.1 enamine deaminase RidA (YjgF/YER057c/UK114 family) [Kineosporia succinea]